MKKTHVAVVVLVFAAVLISGYFGFKLYADNEAKKNLDAVIAQYKDAANIEYRKVAVDLPGMDVRISDILVAPVGEEDKLKIDEVIIHDFDEKSEIPEFLSVSINGIELDLNELGSKAEDLKKLGYEGKIRFNLGAAYIYEEKENYLKIKNLNISADNAGEISMILHVSNIGPASRDLFLLLGMLSKLTVHKAEIVYKDASLAERALKAAAQEEGMAPEELKEEMLDHLSGYIEAEKDEHAKELLKKVQNFVNDPDEFSISLVSEPSTAEKLMKDLQRTVKKYAQHYMAADDMKQKNPGPSVIAEKSDTSVAQASGIDLKSAFRRLENAGFKTGPYQEDDLSGLSEAVKRFQKFAKLEETGIIDESTWAKLKMLYDPEASSAKKEK